MSYTYQDIKELYEVWGMDGSTYQDSAYIPGTPDFVAFKEEGGKFVILRLTFGKYKDVDFDNLSANVREQELALGAYVFPDHRYRNIVDAQVEEVISSLSGLELDMPVKVDIERLSDGNGGTSFPTRSQALAFYKPFYDAIKEITGHPADTYINPSTLILLGPLPDWMLEGDLWIAHWRTNEPTVYEWEDYTFWQVDAFAVGDILGMESGSVDINIFNGTAEEFEQYCADYRGESISTPPIVITQPVDPILIQQVEANTIQVEANTVQVEILNQRLENFISVMRENSANTAKDLDTI